MLEMVQEDRNHCFHRKFDVEEEEDKDHHRRKKKPAKEQHLVSVAVEEQEGSCCRKVIVEAGGMGCYDYFQHHRVIEQRRRVIAEEGNRDVVEGGMRHLVEMVEEGIQSLQDVKLEEVVEGNCSRHRQVEQEQVSPNV
jgi:hypothetical protein